MEQKSFKTTDLKKRKLELVAITLGWSNWMDAVETSAGLWECV